MVKKTVKILGAVFLAYILLCCATPYINVLKKRSIANQINYLSEILDAGYDNTLQKRFPEGKIFSNALLALSIIEFCDTHGQCKKKNSVIVDNCIRRIQSKKAAKLFSNKLYPKYGIFYCGWSNLVYSKYQKSDLFKSSELKSIIAARSQEIEEEICNIQFDSLRILESYSGAKWPADNFIGISSINNDSLKKQWTELIFDKAKNKSGLINHTGHNNSKIRGSSNALITYCLAKNKYQNINHYNELYRSVFVDEYMGIQLVKENEDASNANDIDSGPVLFGYGASATIMNIKTQSSLGNKKSKLTWAAMNTIALPINIFRKKYYLLKKEPMLDLFLLWGSTEL